MMTDEGYKLKPVGLTIKLFFILQALLEFRSLQTYFPFSGHLGSR